MKKKKVFITMIIFLFFLIFLLFLIRIFSPRHLDDVSPEIPCNKKLLEKADVLFVIPKFNNKTIDKKWCEEILALNKTLGLHGVYHSYKEFSQDRDEEYLQEGIDIFIECFGYAPKIFRAPQLELSKNNYKIISLNMKIYGKDSYIFHKIYHCNDSSLPKNRFSDIF
jgi:hypothetical protein